MRGLYLCALPVLLSAHLTSARGADAAPERTIVGVVRFHGKPVAGATVGIVWNSLPAQKPSATKSVVTDNHGRFNLAWPSESKHRPYLLVARDPAGRLGWLDVRGSGIELDYQTVSRIDLLETGAAHGRLTDSNGAPIAKACVRTLYLSVGGDEQNRSYPVPADLEASYTILTDDDGRFTVKGVPLAGGVFAEVTAPGFGAPRLFWRQDVPCDVRLEKAGSIQLRFDGVADPSKIVGLRLFSQRKQDSAAAVKIFEQKEIVVQGVTTLTVPDIVPGDYSLNVHTDDWKTPYVVEKSPEFTVRPGGVSEATIKMSPAAEIRGRVIDESSKKGIAGVWVSITKPTERGYRQVFAWTTTDSAGDYRAFVAPGDLGIAVKPQVGGYRPPADDEKRPTAIVTAGNVHTFPDIALEPAVPVEGMVVDAAGKPLAGITIQTAHTGQRSDNPVSDAEGRFRLTDLGLHETTALRARTATATTDGAVSVRVESPMLPIRLVVSEAHACRLRGRVVDHDGRPIADAAVRMEWRYRGVGRSERYGFGGWGGILYSDADGRFESMAFWPGDEYKVQVEMVGFGKAESAQVRGVAGHVHDFGTLVLPRIAGEVSGMIVDARNQPIAEPARVFNDGDGPKPIATVTGADGRFTLSGFYDGSVYVFVRKAGYRFTAKRVSKRSAYVTVLAADAPPPAQQPDPRPAEYIAAEAKLARHLLDRLWALPNDTLGAFRRTALEGMARIDLERAHQWMDDRRKRGEVDAGNGGALDRALRIAEAESIAASDVDGSIGLLAPLKPDESQRVLAGIARRLRESEPAKALRFAEEATVQARRLPLPNRAWALADAGELLLQLNQPEAGRKVIFEAADFAEKLGPQAMHGYARGYVAARIGPLDLNRAKSLVPRDPANETNRWFAAIAGRTAVQDLNQALAVLDEIRDDESSLKPDSRRRIAVRLAESGKVAEAIKLAESINDHFHPLSAVTAVAAIIGRSDPALSRSLIDRVLDQYVDDPANLLPSSRSYRPTFAAGIAYQARLAGHPDLDSVVGRVLACRLTTQYDSPDRIAAQTAQMALILSLTDPNTAKWLLTRAVPPDRPIPNELSERRDWLFAVALADPERALGEIDKRIEAAKKSDRGLQSSGLAELMDILTQPTEAARDRMLARYGAMAWPRDYGDD